MLEEKHGEDYSESFEGKHAQTLISLFDNIDEDVAKQKKHLRAMVKSNSLLVLSNMYLRMQGVQRRTGKRVHRVVDKNDFEAREKKILRETTWNELMQM